MSIQDLTVLAELVAVTRDPDMTSTSHITLDSVVTRPTGPVDR